jgi:hypothetical protein
MPLDLQRPRDLGRILDDAFAFYRAQFKTLLAVAVAVVLPLYLLVYGVGLGWLWEAYNVAPKGQVRLADISDTIVGIIVQLLVVTPLVTAMTVHVVRTAAAGRPAGTAETLRAGFGVFPQLFGAVALAALGIACGFFLLIIPGVYLAVRLLVVPQVVILEDLRGGDALTRSMALTRGQGWFVFLVWLVTNLLVAVLSSLALLPLDVAAKHADAQAVVLIGQIAGAVITLPILAVAQTLLYHALLAGKQPAAAPPRPSEPASPQTLPGVPGTFGDGFAPPRRPPGA